MTILDILNQIEATPSRNEKEAIIVANKDNDLFCRVLLTAMDPSLNFYISKTPKERYNTSDVKTLDEAIDFILSNFATRKLTGNAAKAEYAALLGTLEEADAIVLERIIKRDLRCGIKDATVNKAFGHDFIYIHPVLLCEKQSNKAIERLFKNSKGYVFCQLKSDGARSTISVYVDKVLVHSRTGELLDFQGRFDYLKDIPEAVGSVFDGELLYRSNGITESRQTSNGIISKVHNGTVSEAELDAIYITAWDMIPLDNFINKKKTTRIYEDRFADLEKFISDHPSSNIDLIKSIRVKTFEEAGEIFKAWMDAKEEGAILKSPLLEWEDKRSKDAVKVKAEETAEFEIVGWEFGEAGKQHEFNLGVLTVATRCRKLLTNIGKGFSQDERETFLGYKDDPSQLLGLIVECSFNMVTKSKNKDTYALFLEKFNRLRFDKKEANSLEEIM